MRRLTVEFAADDMPGFERVESMEVLTFLTSTPDEIALVCRVRLKDTSDKVEDVFADRFEEIQVLKQLGGSFVCFFKQKQRPWPARVNPVHAGGYRSTPYEVKEGRLRATFLGSAKEVRAIIKRIEKRGVTYKVVSITDARFSPDSPLTTLTEKQRKVILTAFTQGYYDVPRRVSSEKLAERLNIREPTLVMHRRKAERRLLSALVGGL